jgi:beta-phosphoglucomutase-like phosphatase (HAD superfamily)
MNHFKQAMQTCLSDRNYPRIDLKAVLFDMDGVLYDSMPAHVQSWHAVMESHHIHFSIEDAYLHEGRTGFDTILITCRKQGISLTDDEINAIYREKTNAFLTCPAARRMPDSYELLQKIVHDGLSPMVVTGSGHASLLDNLNGHFPGIFRRERMVTAFDVKNGKPHPEPYLTALRKGGLQPWEAFVVENAPLGVEAAHAAGLFVIAVNTGPLPDSCLLDAGANLLFPSMSALREAWDEIRKAAFELRIEN